MWQDPEIQAFKLHCEFIWADSSSLLTQKNGLFTWLYELVLPEYSVTVKIILKDDLIPNQSIHLCETPGVMSKWLLFGVAFHTQEHVSPFWKSPLISAALENCGVASFELSDPDLSFLPESALLRFVTSSEDVPCKTCSSPQLFLGQRFSWTVCRVSHRSFKMFCLKIEVKTWLGSERNYCSAARVFMAFS